MKTRILAILPAVAALGLTAPGALAQTATAPAPLNPAPLNPAPLNPAVTATPPAAAPTEVAPAAPPPNTTPAPTPPPYPASPDTLVAPPGPPPPVEPQPQPRIVLQPPPEPQPPAPVYYGPPDGQRRPPRYRYVEGTPLPPGYHLEERANRGLVGGGVAMFAVPYLIGTLGTLSVLGDGNTGWLAIPIAGPWLTLANRRTNCGEIGEPSPGGFECFSDEAGNGLLIASGIMQAVGTAMIALGLTHTREYAVADYAKVHVTPVATPRGEYGLVLSGSM